MSSENIYSQGNILFKRWYCSSTGVLANYGQNIQEVIDEFT